MEVGRLGVSGPNAVSLAAKEDLAYAAELAIIHPHSTEENTASVMLWNPKNALDLHALSLEAGATGTVGRHALSRVVLEDEFSERESAIIPNPLTVEPNAKDLTLTLNSASLNTAQSMEDGAAGRNTSSTVLHAERVDSSLVTESAQTHSQCMEEPSVTETPPMCSQFHCRLALCPVDGPAGPHGLTPVSLVETVEYPSEDEHAQIPNQTLEALTVMVSISRPVLWTKFHARPAAAGRLGLSGPSAARHAALEA